MKKKLGKHNMLPFRWAETFALILIVILFFILFGTDKNTYQIQENHYQSNMWSGCIGPEVRYFGDENMTEAKVRDYLYDVVMQYIPTFGWIGKDTYSTSRIGFAAGFYDAEGNLIVETCERNVLVHFNAYDEEQEKWVELYANLEDYFATSYVDRLIEDCKQRQSVVSVSSVDGYFTEGKEFVLTGMEYRISKGAEDQYQEIKVSTDVPKEQIIHLENTDSTMWIEIYNEKASQNHKALQMLYERVETEAISGYKPNNIYDDFAKGGGASSDNKMMEMTIAGGGVYGYIYYHTPINKFVLTSITFWIKFIFLAAVIQIGILILYALYKEIMEKQQELDHMRNTFLNAMAHEMKTPSAVIKNSAECIRENIYPEKNERYLDMITDEADHMNTLVGQMLMYTRTSEGVYELRMEQIALKDLAQSVCRTHKLQMEEKGMELKLQCKGDKTVAADAVLLKMVIDNFVSNAVRYGRENGVIEIVVEQKQFSIYNDGKALSAKEQKKIWEPLYVIDETRNKTDGSAGMGLAICKNILELHDAKYGVENVNNGVRFYFTLP